MKRLLYSLLSAILIVSILFSTCISVAAEDIARVTSITPETLVLRVGDTVQLTALTNVPGYTNIDWWVLDNSIVSPGRLDGYNNFYSFAPNYSGYYTDSSGREYYYNENGQKSFVTNSDGSQIYYGKFDPDRNYYYTSDDGWYYVDTSGRSSFVGSSIPFSISQFTYYQGRYYATDYFNSESPDYYYYYNYNQNYDRYYWNDSYYSLVNSALYRRGTDSITIQANQVGTTEITAFVNGTQSASCVIRVVDYDSYIDSSYYIVNVTTDGNGAISPAGRIAVAPNTYQNFTIIPNAGYELDQVVLDYRQVLTTHNNQFQLFVDEPYSIYATFKRSTGTSSSQTSSSTGSSKPAETTTPTANPSTGDHIADGFILILMLLIASTVTTGGVLAVQYVRKKHSDD